MFHRFCTCLCGLAFLLMGACGGYDFTINENVVYTPKPLLSGFAAEDAALQHCLEQAVVDFKITSASEMIVLNCSHAGVTSLAGLETFTALAKLKLSANNIRNISPLARLTRLEELHLDSNQIVDPTPLLDLTALVELNLADNPPLLCPSATSLMMLEILTLPAHCS